MAVGETAIMTETPCLAPSPMLPFGKRHQIRRDTYHAAALENGGLMIHWIPEESPSMSTFGRAFYVPAYVEENYIPQLFMETTECCGSVEFYIGSVFDRFVKNRGFGLVSVVHGISVLALKNLCYG
jgi:hypothetical protein